jgi:hypothetical protein
MIRLLSYALIICAIAFNATAKDLYVATDGNDSTTYANNDINNPWLTVEHAWATADDDDVVYYRVGTYTITSIIDNASSGSGVTHTNYNNEVVTWESSLCENNRVISVNEDHTTVDGINGNWTGLESCLSDTGFFVMGWSYVRDNSAEYFTLKNCSWTTQKYGQNGGIVFARVSNDNTGATYCTVENVKITGPGEEYGTQNTSGIMMFGAENWTIKNCEISDVHTGIFFNKHPNNDDTIAGTIENCYIHDVDYAITTQANYLTVSNNILAAQVWMGENSGDAVDDNVGSDHNTFDHNTFVDWITMEDKTDGEDNEWPGSQYNNFTNNIFPTVPQLGWTVGAHPYRSVDPHYSGDYNLLSVDGRWRINEVTYTVSTVQTLLGGCPNTGNECNSIAQDPTFVGGASPSTIAGFALTSESYGYQACADGSDMGADVSLVGVDADSETSITSHASGNFSMSGQ